MYVGLCLPRSCCARVFRECVCCAVVLSGRGGMPTPQAVPGRWQQSDAAKDAAVHRQRVVTCLQITTPCFCALRSKTCSSPSARRRRVSKNNDSFFFRTLLEKRTKVCSIWGWLVLRHHSKMKPQYESNRNHKGECHVFATPQVAHGPPDSPRSCAKSTACLVTWLCESTA